MDIKLLLENQLVIMRYLLKLEHGPLDKVETQIMMQIEQTTKRIAEWRSDVA